MHTDSLINKYFCNGTIEMENREEESYGNKRAPLQKLIRVICRTTFKSKHLISADNKRVLRTDSSNRFCIPILRRFDSFLLHKD